jgi:competence ComEA-like helix-hairpin-helix protein
MKRGLSRIGRIASVALIATIFILSSLACVKLQRHRPPAAYGSRAGLYTSPTETKEALLININTASAEELERLPGIGRALASRIISHREQYGSFRRPEHLIIVRGIGERRFRRLRPFITVE